MILKWVEYKIICDKCSQDIIGWNGHETRKDLIRAYKDEFGKLPKPKQTICSACIGLSFQPNETKHKTNHDRT